MNGLFFAAAFWLLIAIGSTWLVFSARDGKWLSHLGFAVFHWSIVLVASGVAFADGRPPGWLLGLFICGLLGGMLVALVGERVANLRQKHHRKHEDDDNDARWKEAIREG